MTAVAAVDSDASDGGREPQKVAAICSHIALDTDYIAAAPAQLAAAWGGTCRLCCRTAAACVAYSAAPAPAQRKIPPAALARKRMDTVGVAGNSSSMHAKNAKVSNNRRYT